MAEGRARTFVAIEPSPSTHAALVRLKAALAATSADVRWVRDTALHCTVKFLGAVEVKHLEAVRDRLQEALSRCPSTTAVARGLGVFPSPKHPQILWVGFEGAGLAELADKVDTALSTLGFPRERRAFTPHITLGRVKGRRGWDSVEEVMKAHAAEEFGTTRIDRVVVYRSDLRPDGAVHTPLWTIALRDSTLAES